MAGTLAKDIASYRITSEQDNHLHEPTPNHGDAQHYLNDARVGLNLQGFVLIIPTLDRVYWSEPAASLHGEDADTCTQFNLRQFMQWYEPNQRDLFVQSLFSEQQSHGFQIDLCIAHSNQYLRYLCIPIAYKSSVMWAGFVRATIAHKKEVMLDFTLRKARRLLAALE